MPAGEGLLLRGGGGARGRGEGFGEPELAAGYAKPGQKMRRGEVVDEEKWNDLGVWKLRSDSCMQAATV